MEYAAVSAMQLVKLNPALVLGDEIALCAIVMRGNDIRHRSILAQLKSRQTDRHYCHIRFAHESVAHQILAQLDDCALGIRVTS